MCYVFAHISDHKFQELGKTPKPGILKLGGPYIEGASVSESWISRKSTSKYVGWAFFALKTVVFLFNHEIA